MKSPPPVFVEGPREIERHQHIAEGLLLPLPRIGLEPYRSSVDDAENAVEAWARSPRAERGVLIGWTGVQALDFERRGTPERPGELGELHGCTKEEFIRAHAVGYGRIDRDLDLLTQRLGRARERLLAAQRRLIYCNTEIQTGPDWMDARAMDVYRAIYADKACVRRMGRELAALKPWQMPDDFETRLKWRRLYGRYIHTIKVETHRRLLSMAGLLVPGTDVVLSFCRYGTENAYAGDFNGAATPALRAPRVKGVRFLSNGQFYGEDEVMVARAEAFARCAGPTMSHFRALNGHITALQLRYCSPDGSIIYVDPKYGPTVKWQVDQAGYAVKLAGLAWEGGEA